MTADELKDRLYSRHYASSAQMPGPWTVIEEFRGIDLLAWSAWSSADSYARIGYEVKVSRSDLRRELLTPSKRAFNVEWCNEFYFAVPSGLFTTDELAYEEPEWEPGDFNGEDCPGFARAPCRPITHRRKTHHVRVPLPTIGRWLEWEHVLCPTCSGKGVVTPSRVEREAPTVWLPRDVGLVMVDGRGTRLIKQSPRRTAVPALSPRDLGQLVRWVSMRPDPRHHPLRNEEAA